MPNSLAICVTASSASSLPMPMKRGLLSSKACSACVMAAPGSWRARAAMRRSVVTPWASACRLLLAGWRMKSSTAAKERSRQLPMASASHVSASSRAPSPAAISAMSWLRVPLAQKLWSWRKTSPLRCAFAHKRLMKGAMSVLTSVVLSSLTSAVESALIDLRLAEVAPERAAQLRSSRSSSTVTLAGAVPAAGGGAAPAPGIGAGGGAGAGGGCGAAAGTQA